MNVQESNWLRQVALQEEQARERWLLNQKYPPQPLYPPERVAVNLPPVQLVGSKLRPVERINTVTMPLAGSRSTDGAPITLAWEAEPAYVAPKIGQPPVVQPRWDPRVQQVPQTYNTNEYIYTNTSQPVVTTGATAKSTVPACMHGGPCNSTCGHQVVQQMVPVTVQTQQMRPVTKAVPVKEEYVSYEPVVRERTVIHNHTEFEPEPVECQVYVPYETVQHCHIHPLVNGCASCSCMQQQQIQPQIQPQSQPQSQPYMYQPQPNYVYSAQDGALNHVSTLDCGYGGHQNTNAAAVAATTSTTAPYDTYTQPLPYAKCTSHAQLHKHIAKHKPMEHTYHDCRQSCSGYTSSTTTPARPHTPHHAYQTQTSTTSVSGGCTVSGCLVEGCTGHHAHTIYTPVKSSPVHTLYVGVVTKQIQNEVHVLGVRPGSPAHHAGILPEDVIVSVAGVKVTSTPGMHKLFELHGQGQRVTGCRPVNITVRRHGKIMCLMVTPIMKY